MKRRKTGRIGAADHLPRVRSSEEARALAALGAGRPALPGGAVRVAVVLRGDQVEALRVRGVNRSELLRALVDEWLSRAE